MTAVLKAIEQVPDPTIVQRVEELLEAARRGDVRALGFAAILQNGDAQTCIVNEGLHAFTMLGALERLKLRYHNTVMDEYQ